MTVTAVLGAQWGDEGKGKLVDVLARDGDIVARFSGGNNAGHTVITEQGEFKFHLLPSGVVWPHTLNVIGNGVVVDPDVLLDEITGLEARGISIEGRLIVSERSHLVMPYHVVLDQISEQAKGRNAIGTTGRGIGPAYADKASRIGIRATELRDIEALLPRLEVVLNHHNAILTKVYGVEPLALDEVFDRCKLWSEHLLDYIGPVEHIVFDSVNSGKHLIIEGAQGALLDLDHGTYPFVTSSHPTIGGAMTGLGLLPGQIDSVLGVFKAYSTRVGSGPFVTELHGNTGEAIRQRAKEFGTTTGRPRRVGWFDSVAARYSARINGYTGGIITRLDVLDIFDSINVCRAYELDGEIVWDFPGNASTLERCIPIYEELPGWDMPTAGMNAYEDLPANAKAYVDRIQELVGVGFDIISTGPHRDETIHVRPMVAL